MDLTDFFNAIGAGQIVGKCGIAMLVVMTILQIAPIKINPWSWLGKTIRKGLNILARNIGRAINGEVINELGNIKTRLDDIETRNLNNDAKMAEDKAKDARRRILRFADEVRSGVRHSEEHFDNVFEDVKYYTTYCKQHEEFENDKVRISIKILNEVYEKCVKENDFL